MMPRGQSQGRSLLGARAAILTCGAMLAIVWFAGRLIGSTPSASASTSGVGAKEIKVAGATERRSWSKVANPDASIVRDPFESSLLVARGKEGSVKRSVTPVKQAPTNEEMQREAAGRLELKGVSMGRVPVAIINGQACRESEMVGGFRVVKIDAKQVVVERDGVQITLWMK